MDQKRKSNFDFLFMEGKKGEKKGERGKTAII